jgi:threonine/homoserine/homoserine lactone efflux protein
MLLPSLSLFSAFLAASFLLAVTPGPGVLYIVARTLAEGRRAGFASVLGIALGNLGNALAAAVGLSALLKVAPVAWIGLKYAGALYLAYLGLRALYRARAVVSATAPPPAPPAHIFKEALIVALTNPKTALFFAAFLPRFTEPPGHLPQTVLLGFLFVAMALVTDSLFALVAGTLAPALARLPSAQAGGQYLHAIVLLALAILTAWP